MTRRYFFTSILLSAIAATPITLVLVVFQGARVNLAAGPEAVHDATLALMQTFIMSCDVSVVAMWLPYALLLSRLKSH